MHHLNLHRWRHDHTFAQDRQRFGERRPLLVIALTAAMIVVAVATGLVYGPMALLADGRHMASHAAAVDQGAPTETGRWLR